MLQMQWQFKVPSNIRYFINIDVHMHVYVCNVFVLVSREQTKNQPHTYLREKKESFAQGVKEISIRWN